MPYEIAALAGKPYTPSNGDEGRMFHERFCTRCINEDFDNEVFCPIYTNAIMGEQPPEWIHDERGRPKCAARKPLTWDDEQRQRLTAARAPSL